MAIVISILDERPAPQPGEGALYLTLSYREPTPNNEENGFRMVAKTEKNRVIGRWVSDCPLSTVKSCLLWITSNPPQTQAWEIYETQDSLGFESVMAEVPNPTSQYAAPPRDLASLLAKNLPGSQPTARITARPVPPQLAARPQQQIPGPVAAPPPQSAPMRAPAVPQSAPQAALPEPPPEPPRPRGSLGGDERDVAIFLRNAMRELKSGAPADHIREALFAYAIPEDMVLDDDEFDDEYDEEYADEGPDDEGWVEKLNRDQHAPPKISPNPVSEVHEQDALVSASMGGLPVGLRPLGPDELPPNLSDEQRSAYEGLGGDDEGIREKLRRTHGRARDAVAHAERVAAMRERERQLLNAQAESEAVATTGNGKAGPAATKLAVQAAEDELDAMDESDEVDDTMALLDNIVSAPVRPTNGGGPPVEVASVAPPVTLSPLPKPKRKRKRKQA